MTLRVHLYTQFRSMTCFVPVVDLSRVDHVVNHSSASHGPAPSHDPDGFGRHSLRQASVQLSPSAPRNRTNGRSFALRSQSSLDPLRLLFTEHEERERASTRKGWVGGLEGLEWEGGRVEASFSICITDMPLPPPCSAKREALSGDSCR